MEKITFEQRFSWVMGAVCTLIFVGASIANATITEDAPKVEEVNITFATPEEWDEVKAWAEEHPDANECPLPWARW